MHRNDSAEIIIVVTLRRKGGKWDWGRDSRDGFNFIYNIYIGMGKRKNLKTIDNFKTVFFL